MAAYTSDGVLITNQPEGQTYKVCRNCGESRPIEKFPLSWNNPYKKINKSRAGVCQRCQDKRRARGSK